ncbi:MAG: type II secretion system protein [Candidatus Hydrogenedentes bacterium]|nr:type II secretion system protein [Candidatus Hydrogenedentota bacterium]
MIHHANRRGRVRRCRLGEAGMTLVEIMIASGIMTIAFVFIMGSIISISTATSCTEEQMLAGATVSSVMEELHSLSYEELLAYQPAAAAQLGATATVTAVCYDVNGGANILPLDPDSLAAPLPNPVEVQVTVTWRDKMGRPFARRASAFYGR